MLQHGHMHARWRYCHASRCRLGAAACGRRAARRAQSLLNCLMYKLSYYRFGEGALMATGRMGFDRVRQARAHPAAPASQRAPGSTRAHGAIAGHDARAAWPRWRRARVSAGVRERRLRRGVSQFGLMSRAPPRPRGTAAQGPLCM
jgi:hypothetical protein